MAVRSSDEIASILRKQIEGFDQAVQDTNVGTVTEVGDGIARIWGLSNVMASELLDFGNGVMGLALNLEEDTVGSIILGPYTGIAEGDEVRSTGRVIEIPVGDALIGRVVDALGQRLAVFRQGLHDVRLDIEGDQARLIAGLHLIDVGLSRRLGGLQFAGDSHAAGDVDGQHRRQRADLARPADRLGLDRLAVFVKLQLLRRHRHRFPGVIRRRDVDVDHRKVGTVDLRDLHVRSARGVLQRREGPRHQHERSDRQASPQPEGCAHRLTFFRDR